MLFQVKGERLCFASTLQTHTTVKQQQQIDYFHVIEKYNWDTNQKFPQVFSFPTWSFSHLYFSQLSCSALIASEKVCDHRKQKGRRRGGEKEEEKVFLRWLVSIKHLYSQIRLTT